MSRSLTLPRLEHLEHELEDGGHVGNGDRLPGTLEEVEEIAFGAPRLVRGGGLARRRLSS